ncbi:O-antigen ligase|uniref:O-antigen ligase n=3 Tax=Brenneria salicis TaxID=55214 RepID=A0A366I087_9GAMM|nr:O-antigen ligase family protein [Brenneria salicis]NMN90079.1 O-antigen ligase [Brenneria salicis ATCC 15712 = DSM 30166]RBP59239.1 O-antigen ligase [Brenneria salicis ATCC 15712 = DSM 30166]
MKNIETNTRENIFPTVIYIGLIIALSVMIFDSRLSVKIFNNIGVISIIFLFFVIKKDDINRKNTMVAASMLLLCIINFIWEFIYKTNNSEFSGVYRSYHSVEKILFLGSIIILLILLLTSKYKTKKIIPIGICAIPFLLLGFFYFFDGVGRFRLSDGIPTTSGYMITFIGILISQAIILINPKGRINFFLSNYALSFILIIYTETRAAILSYPLLSLVILTPFIFKGKRIDYKIIAKLLVVSITCLAICYDTINTRTNNLFSDLERYNQSDSNTSVGARIAMYKAGLSSFLDAPMGQSLESRATNIKQQVDKDPSIIGASQYTNVHLHNEFIEAISLKGVFGGIALLMCYLSLIYFFLFFIRDYSIIALSLSLFIYGLSDVIFYDNNITIVWILTYCLSIILAQSKKNTLPLKMPLFNKSVTLK